MESIHTKDKRRNFKIHSTSLKYRNFRILFWNVFCFENGCIVWLGSFKSKVFVKINTLYIKNYWLLINFILNDESIICYKKRNNSIRKAPTWNTLYQKQRTKFACSVLFNKINLNEKCNYIFLSHKKVMNSFQKKFYLVNS